MRTFRLVMIAAVLACGTPVMAGDIAPGGTLRAVYLTLEVIYLMNKRPFCLRDRASSRFP